MVLYVVVCITLFTCYGKILAVSWRHRRRIEHQRANVDSAPGPSLQATTTVSVKQNSRAASGGNTEDSNENPMTGAGASSALAVTSGVATSERTLEEQRQKIKSRHREFKATYLTAALVGSYVILTFPYILGRILESAAYNPVVTGYISRVGGALGTFYMTSTWAIYAAVSRSYRRAYRQMLIRIGCHCGKKGTLPADNSLVV